MSRITLVTSELVHSGPLYRDASFENGVARIRFEHRGGGLSTIDNKPPSHFEIAGDDQIYHPAKARIDGETVVVSSSEVSSPVAVRFAWSNIAEPNLFNAEGLPASSFCSDQWKRITDR